MAAEETRFLNITSVAPVGGTAPTAVTYNEFRLNNIVDRASDWKLAIVRFACAGLFLPIFIPLIQPGQNDPNVTVYQLTVTWTNSSGVPTYATTVPVTWTPQFADQPAPANAGELFNSLYYYSTTYNHFLACINKALATAFISTMNQLPPPLLTLKPPFFAYETNADRFVLYQDAAGTAAFSITMNGALRLLLNHFPCVFANVNAATIVPDTSPSATIAVLGGTSYLAMKQESASTDVWSPIGSLTFATTLPIIAEDSSPANLLGAAGPTASRNFVQSLTDISLPLSSGSSDWLNNVTYNATVYRWSTLLGNSPLKELNFDVFWINRFNGAAYQCFFRPGGGGSISMKLMLKRIRGGDDE